MWRITVSDKCISSGSCVGLAPERFEIDDFEGRSHPTPADIDPDDAVLDAVASCPMEAITVVDLDTGEPIEV
ncbi:MAG TPA: ferredoxin [Dactylosporangium sp.]|jgi:ferredoxin|nr:ferredoxin [Dactylosporangium sp.]